MMTAKKGSDDRKMSSENIRLIDKENLVRYAQIYEINTRIQQMEQEIRRIELENSTLKLEVAKLQDNKRLLEISKELGYVPADSITEISLSSVESDVSIAMSGQE